MNCPRCGTPMQGGVCPECGFPVNRARRKKNPSAQTRIILTERKA